MKRQSTLFLVICVVFGCLAAYTPNTSTAPNPGVEKLSSDLKSPTQDQPVSYINGHWFDGSTFRSGARHVVNGRFTNRAPDGITNKIDLENRFVIPPLGDAHQHVFNSNEHIAGDIKNFLEHGVFYVMVQDALGEVGADVLARVNIPTSVDVAYTWAPIIGDGHGLLDYFKALGEKGQFGEAKTLEKLDTRAFYLINNKADLDRKWPKIAETKIDFIKVILAFSEEHDRRRRDPRTYADAAFQMARPGVPPNLLELIVKKAHRDGRRVSVHIETANDFRVAVEAGADLIAHLPGWHLGPTAGFADESLDHWIISEADARLAARKRVAVITTTYPKPFFDNAKLAEKFRQVHRENLARLIRNGVTIALGADNSEAMAYGEAQHLASFGVFNNHALLKMLVETTPKVIFPNRRIGCLEDGCEASFLVLEGDPLQHLTNLQRIVRRVKQGREL